jgi:hypothetical protein
MVCFLIMHYALTQDFTQFLLLKKNIINICLEEVVKKHQYYNSCLVRCTFYILNTSEELLSHIRTNINI